MARRCRCLYLLRVQKPSRVSKTVVVFFVLTRNFPRASQKISSASQKISSQGRTGEARKKDFFATASSVWIKMLIRRRPKEIFTSGDFAALHPAFFRSEKKCIGALRRFSKNRETHSRNQEKFFPARLCRSSSLAESKMDEHRHRQRRASTKIFHADDSKFRERRFFLSRVSRYTLES